MRSLAFSGRRIKTPERGLLALHPFVDVLEGRSLFTATAHDGVMDVTAVADAPAAEGTPTPWSTRFVDPGAAADRAADGAVAAGSTAGAADGLGDLLAATTPGRIELEAGTSGSAFAAAGTIGDTGQTLFGNALWDRRGRDAAPPLPTDDQLAAARQARAAGGTAGGTAAFRDGRGLTGAMGPYLTMSAAQANHPFAA